MVRGSLGRVSQWMLILLRLLRWIKGFNVDGWSSARVEASKKKPTASLADYCLRISIRKKQRHWARVASGMRRRRLMQECVVAQPLVNTIPIHDLCRTSPLSSEDSIVLVDIVRPAPTRDVNFIYDTHTRHGDSSED